MTHITEVTPKALSPITREDWDIITLDLSHVSRVAFVNPELTGDERDAEIMLELTCASSER